MRLTQKLVAVAVAAAFTTGAFAADAPKNPKKQTKAGLYLSAKEAPAFMKKNKDSVVFIDVRTRAEMEFVGYARSMDKNIPLHFKTWTEWRKDKSRFSDAPMNENFVSDVEALVKSKGLTKESAKVVLMCRSGDRSAVSSNKLLAAGFKFPYTIIDGFEGGIAKDTLHRTKNGWKNAGNPWTYKLDKTKMYIK